MTFPQFYNKHLEQALFEPEEFIQYARLECKNFPKKIVITYQRSASSYFRERYKGEFEEIDFISSHKILDRNGVGLIRMNGIGAPHAVTIFEELIAVGAREFINIGTAGGLQKQGVFLADRAIRDEGTSHHYLPNEKYAFPDEELTVRFGEAIKSQGLEFTLAPTWTTDALYRETRAEVAHYREEGVATVEMEASALFSVAKVRGVKIAAAFTVSDILREKWEPMFQKIDVRESLNKLVDASLSCLVSS
jgi:uridine phosphorylase